MCDAGERSFNTFLPRKNSPKPGCVRGFYLVPFGGRGSFLDFTPTFGCDILLSIEGEVSDKVFHRGFEVSHCAAGAELVLVEDR